MRVSLNIALVVALTAVSGCLGGRTGLSNTASRLEGRSADAATDARDDIDTRPEWGAPAEDFGRHGEYRYVMVQDMENHDISSVTHTGGVDIYGLQLVAGDRVLNASRIYDCSFGAGDNALARDCDQVLGEPEGWCSLDSNVPDFVSLGGEPGQVIVSFGDLEVIREGDEITVFECGLPEPDEGEWYNVYLSTDPDMPFETWVPVCMWETGVASCEVPALPETNPD